MNNKINNIEQKETDITFKFSIAGGLEVERVLFYPSFFLSSSFLTW